MDLEHGHLGFDVSELAAFTDTTHVSPGRIDVAESQCRYTWLAAWDGN
jgi:hypothetical protein